MYSCKSIQKILALIVFTLFLSLSSTSVASVAIPDVDPTDAAAVAKAKDGMTLFKANCTACHAIDRKVVGPALGGVWDRWESEDKLIEWVHNSSKLIASGDAYANKVFNDNNKVPMPGYPQFTPDQVKDILLYIKNPNATEPAKPAAAAGTAGAAAGGANQGASTWYVWTLVGFLAVLSVLLWNITSKLNKVIREKAGEVVEEESLGQK